MKRHTSEFTKGQIIALFNENFSYADISKKLNIPKSTIGYIIKKFKNVGSIHRKPGSGRKEILSADEKRALQDISDNAPRKNAKEIRNEITDITKKQLSKKTVIRYLAEDQLFARIAHKKPFISPKNKLLRYEISKKFLAISNETWRTVIFTDEASFEMFPTRKRQTIYRRPGTAFETKNLVPSVKFGGGKVMVWRCVSHKGVGNLVFVDGKINSGKYINILANNLKDSASKMNLSSYIFQQDSAPCHKSKTTMDYFEAEEIALLDWAPQSPDLNPIEHVWAYIKLKLRDFIPKNLDDLKRKILEIWYAIPLDYIQKLIDGMLKRSCAVFEAKGDNSKY